MSGPSWVWGVPLSPLTRTEAAEEVIRLIGVGRPSYLISVNTNYAMLTAERPELRAINDKAAMLLVDGAPLVWASRRGPGPLPERVAGSDFIYNLCEHVAKAGKSIYLLGGREGVADEAARRFQAMYPGLRVVGTACPPPGAMAGPECAEIVARVREARPDVLLLALSQPTGELWMAEHCEELGVPVCIQFGATLDFVAGRVRRAPLVLQKAGLEWAYRTWLEPRRMIPRYLKNARFLFSRVARDLTRKRDPRAEGQRVTQGVGPRQAGDE